jgi:hypothetical protein
MVLRANMCKWETNNLQDSTRGPQTPDATEDIDVLQKQL